MHASGSESSRVARRCWRADWGAAHQPVVCGEPTDNARRKHGCPVARAERGAARPNAVALAVVLFGIIDAVLPAQCASTWQLETAEAERQISASLVWTPPGGYPQQLVVGGRFTGAGSSVAHNIAAYDLALSTWSSLGGGFDGPVNALCSLPNGELVAAGRFTHAGSQACSRIARWNGQSWNPLGSGMDADVLALIVMPNGDLVAGGSFTSAGGVTTGSVARWNGLTWSPIGNLSAGVRCFALMPNGDLAVGGNFGFFTVALFTSGAWQPIKSMTWVAAPRFDFCSSLNVMPSGELVATGAFFVSGRTLYTPDLYYGEAHWTGVGMQWNSTRLNETVYCAHQHAGTLFLGVFVEESTTPPPPLFARHYQLSPLPVSSSPFGPVSTMVDLPDGSLVAGGAFWTIGNTSPPAVFAQSLAIYRGGAWTVPAGLDFPFPGGRGRAVAVGSDGSEFLAAAVRADPTVENVYRRTPGGPWAVLRGPFIGSIRALCARRNGHVVAGGAFPRIFVNVVVSNIAEWDGVAWRSLGSGTNGLVQALAELPSGDLVIGGTFSTVGGVGCNCVARWDGTQWHAMGTGANNTVMALTTLPNGSLVAGGSFTSIGSVATRGVAQWDGTNWSAMGAGLSGGYVSALASTAAGELVAGGASMTSTGTTLGGVARWDGQSWLPVGPLPRAVSAIAALPNGDLVAWGNVDPNGVGVAWWGGAQWSAVLLPQRQSVPLFDEAYAAAVGRNGRVLLAGRLFTANVEECHLVDWFPSCPAFSAEYGSGCTNGGTPCVLESLASPWAGATYRARATGMPTSGLAIGLWGLTQQQVPLSQQFPQSGAGCDQLTTADIMTFTPANGGVAETELFVPRGTWLVGITGFHQVVGVDFAAPGGPLAVSTNGLRLTVGAY